MEVMYSYALHIQAAGTSDVGTYLPTTPHQITEQKAFFISKYSYVVPSKYIITFHIHIKQLGQLLFCISQFSKQCKEGG
jgi:hypothetical protein